MGGYPGLSMWVLDVTNKRPYEREVLEVSHTGRRGCEGGAEGFKDALWAWKQSPAVGCKNTALEAAKARKGILL